MSESKSGITDSVEVEHVSAEQELQELVAAQEAPVEAPVDEVSPQQLVVVNFEDSWTAQSSHGVLLDHFVPTQDYKAIEADPNERQLEPGNDW